MPEGIRDGRPDIGVNGSYCTPDNCSTVSAGQAVGIKEVLIIIHSGISNYSQNINGHQRGLFCGAGQMSAQETATSQQDDEIRKLQTEMDEPRKQMAESGRTAWILAPSSSTDGCRRRGGQCE
jgi:hypothetical protein